MHDSAQDEDDWNEEDWAVYGEFEEILDSWDSLSEGNDVERWGELKYTFSAIAPDIHDLFLTGEGKLDKLAKLMCKTLIVHAPVMSTRTSSVRKKSTGA